MSNQTTCTVKDCAREINHSGIHMDKAGRGFGEVVPWTCHMEFGTNCSLAPGHWGPHDTCIIGSCARERNHSGKHMEKDGTILNLSIATCCLNKARHTGADDCLIKLVEDCPHCDLALEEREKWKSKYYDLSSALREALALVGGK